MGTKNNPGKFDCYANAEPNEPMFVLLGRDRDAPLLITLWANLREHRGDDPEQVAEARACAAACEEFCAERAARERDAVQNPPVDWRARYLEEQAKLEEAVARLTNERDGYRQHALTAKAERDAAIARAERAERVK